MLPYVSCAVGALLLCFTRSVARILSANFWLFQQFLVMFRSRFSAAFSPKLSHYGPQDIERGVEGPTPTPQIENLLCALLALVLNRKKPVEYVLQWSLTPHDSQAKQLPRISRLTLCKARSPWTSIGGGYVVAESTMANPMEGG